MTRAVALLSGGLDSTVLAYRLVGDYGAENVDFLSFDYGQRHKKELEASRQIVGVLKGHHAIVELKVANEHVSNGFEAYFGNPVTTENAPHPLAVLLGPSVLVNPQATVPDGHYADENMKQTVVPNRNAIMLSIAYGVALARGADFVAFAAHSGDHAIYPDCRPDFVRALSDALQIGAAWTQDEKVPYIVGPFLDMSKADIVKLGQTYGVPFQLTWSCYKGGSIHCGTCGTCYERREAFELANVPDRTEYLDSTTTFAAPV